VTIRVLSGDYDRDGMVDGSDLALWQSTYGESVVAGSFADGNVNGIIDGRDFLIWQKNFQAGFESQLAVPEPSTLPMAIVAGCGLGMAHRRRKVTLRI
jgi:hypothetical protein